MKNITLNALNVDLIARYGKMKLDVTIHQDRTAKKNKGLRIRIEDAADNCHVNPHLDWNGKAVFTFHNGCCFGGQGADWPEFNDKLRALEKDRIFAKWFKDNILPVANRLTEV